MHITESSCPSPQDFDTKAFYFFGNLRISVPSAQWAFGAKMTSDRCDDADRR